MNDECTAPFDGGNISKVGEYLDLVEVRVLRALSSEAVQGSCSITLLLVFATIDALGKLTHPRAKAGAGERFRYFLDFMGEEYKQRSKELWKLRNALVHNVINVESYLSSTELEGWVHLQPIRGGRFIYVNSRLASRNLMAAFGRVKTLLATDRNAWRQAEERLEWVENTLQAMSSDPSPTPPPPVQFIQAP